LNAWFAAEAVDMRQYEPCPQETERDGEGLTLAAFGGIGSALAALLPGIRRHAEQGIENVVSYLSQTRDFLDSQALIFEPYACKGGCANGPGLGNPGLSGEPDFLKRREKTDLKNIFELFSYYDETLKLQDFCHCV
jgi:hypothetical protein